MKSNKFLMSIDLRMTKPYMLDEYHYKIKTNFSTVENVNQYTQLSQVFHCLLDI